MQTYELQMPEEVVKFSMPINMKSISTEEMPPEFQNLQLDNGRYVFGRGSVPIVDNQGDKIELEAIRDGAKDLTKPPYNKIFLAHNYGDVAVGKVMATAVDMNGLLVLAKLNEDHQRADEVWNSIQSGHLDAFSVGGSFLRIEEEFDEDIGKIVRVIKKVIFREVSLTSIPANPEALVGGAFQKSRNLMDDIKSGNSERFKYLLVFNKTMTDKNTQKVEDEKKEEQSQESQENEPENVSENEPENVSENESKESEESNETSESEEPTEEKSEDTDDKSKESDEEEEKDEEDESAKDLNSSNNSKIQELEKTIEELKKEVKDLKTPKETKKDIGERQSKVTKTNKYDKESKKKGIDFLELIQKAQ